MFSGRERKKFGDDVATASSIALKYPLKLNFYDKPPLFDVTVEEFETCALDRLRVLAEIESSAARNRTWDETKTVTRTQCSKYLRLDSLSRDMEEQEMLRRSDHLGHFVLRLAFCRSEDLRNRFIKAETTLFKVRYEEDADNQERQQFLNSRDFNWITVDPKEKNDYEDQLTTCLQGIKTDGERKKAFDTESFFKVKWTRVPDLIEKRKVFLRGGLAYVPGREKSSIVYQEYQVQLKKALEMTAKALPRLDEDSRLLPILNNLSQGFLAGVPSEWVGGATESHGEEIKAEMIDDMAKKHYPLCMRNLHENLRQDRHLKHFERLNYGLFLKVLGLSIDEAIAFWRKSFMGGKVKEDQFNKEYKYNIRHSYGLEGRRANYPAKSCSQLLMAESSSHGCPYRYFTSENLHTALLSSYGNQGLSSSDLPEILKIVKDTHYHVACTRVFEITHGGCGVRKGDGVGGGESITHPNQYAARSIELEKGRNGDAMQVDS